MTNCVDQMLAYQIAAGLFPGELPWSGISGTAMFVQPAEQWFASMFSCNLTARMMVRLEFRRAAARL